MRALVLASSLFACCLAYVSAGHASERIITLTPHATEMVFAAGAGQQIVGTVESSDFPDAAKSIARVGDGISTSVEQVLALKPDWVIGWPSPLLSKLHELGIQTLASSPTSLEAVSQEVLLLGKTFGTSPQAKAWHAQFTQKLNQLDRFTTLKADKTLRIVVLASSDAQFAIGRHPLINDTLAHCGAINPFATTQAAAPQISPESLIAAKPDVIISGRLLDHPQPMMPTVPFTVIDADTLYRPGPRFIDAALAICELAQQVQQKRTKQ